MQDMRLFEGMRDDHTYVIFALDDWTKENELIAAMWKVGVGGEYMTPFKRCLGMWEGKLEFSYVVTNSDYVDYVKPSGLTKEQQCLMYVHKRSRRCQLRWQATDSIEAIGILRQIPRRDAMGGKITGFTYDPSSNWYYSTQEVGEEHASAEAA